MTTTTTDAQPRRSRSGSRAPVNPKTKAQRVLRVKELTERIADRAAEVEDLSEKRAKVIRELRFEDRLTIREVSELVGLSPQGVHKATKGTPVTPS